MLSIDGSDDVHSPYGKWPRGYHRIQLLWKRMDLISVDLTLTPLLHKFDAIAFYVEPEVTHPHYLLGEYKATHM